LDPARDRAAAATVHAEYDRGLAGPLVRDAAAWAAQPAWTALYPKEDPGLALVAEGPDGRPAAYIRGAMDTHVGWARVLEWAARPGAPVGALAAEFVRAA